MTKWLPWRNEVDTLIASSGYLDKTLSMLTFMKERIVDFPDCWEELQPVEWVELLKLRHKLAARRGVSLLDVKRAWCAFVLRNRGMRVRGTEGMLLVDRLAGTLDWMWLVDEEEGCVALRFDTTRNLLPTWKGLRGPQSHGADLTFGEFRAATASMNLYTEDHLPSDLLALAAVLYRRPDASGKRLPFDADELPCCMKAAQAMPDWLQWGVYAWFARFCDYLLTGEFVIDGQTITFAPVFGRREKDAPRPSGQDLGLNSILYTVAESGVFGTAADTDRAPLLRVLLKLLDDKQRADELMKRYNKK